MGHPYGNADLAGRLESEIMTKNLAALIFAASLTSVAVSQLMFKAGMTRIAEQAGGAPRAQMIRYALTAPLMWVGAIALVTGATCWYIAMIRLPLSLMMPLAALIAPAVSIAAWGFFGEPLTPQMVAAISLIAVGALWLGWLNT